MARPGEVLVRVHAASVNAYDVVVAAGFMKDFLPYEFPAVLGSDTAGTIEAVGEGVDGFSAGDRVFDPPRRARDRLGAPGQRELRRRSRAGESSQIGGVSASNVGADPVHLPALADLVVQGKLRVAISHTYALADAGRALQNFANEHTLGKLVITMI